MADKEVAPEPTDFIVDPREEALLRARNAITGVCFVAIFVVAFIALVGEPTTEDAVFTMELAAFTGLNATVGPTVSPAFTLKVCVKNPSAVQRWCSDGGEVIVSYSDVALAWGQVPALCVRGGATSELAVLPWGWEVGLSEDLRRRLVSEWWTGTAQLSVDMRLFSPDCGSRYRSFYRFEHMLKDVDQGQIG